MGFLFKYTLKIYSIFIAITPTHGKIHYNMFFQSHISMYMISWHKGILNRRDKLRISPLNVV